MNKNRRDKLTQALAALNTAESLVNTALDEEQFCLDNLPENLEGSERYEKMETAVENLEYAIEGIDSAMEYIAEASN